MSDDRLPAHAPKPAISEELRQREIEVLQRLLVSGKVDQDTFERGLDELLGARTDAEVRFWLGRDVEHETPGSQPCP